MVLDRIARQLAFLLHFLAKLLAVRRLTLAVDVHVSEVLSDIVNHLCVGQRHASNALILVGRQRRHQLVWAIPVLHHLLAGLSQCSRGNFVHPGDKPWQLSDKIGDIRLGTLDLLLVGAELLARHEVCRIFNQLLQRSGAINVKVWRNLYWPRALPVKQGRG